VRLIYITRTNISSNAAQARQIISMATAFHGQLNSMFQLLASGSDCSGELPFKRKLMNPNRRQSIRYLAMVFKGVIEWLKGDDVVIYTRDIGVAFAVVLFKGFAVYEAHKDPKGVVATWLNRRLVKSERACIVTISKALEHYYISTIGAEKERILTAHDGVFSDAYKFLRKKDKNEIRRSLCLPTDKILVIHTGSLYKGGAELFEHVAKAGGEEVEFIHVGGRLKEIEYWSAYYKDRKITNIRFIAHQSSERVMMYQVSADLLFFSMTDKSPISWCTSPLKIFEYMAAGLPILGARLGSVKEILNESNAFCYDPGDPESIKSAYHHFRMDSSEAHQRVMYALHQAECEYSWNNRAAVIIEYILKRKKQS